VLHKTSRAQIYFRDSSSEFVFIMELTLLISTCIQKLMNGFEACNTEQSELIMTLIEMICSCLHGIAARRFHACVVSHRQKSTMIHNMKHKKTRIVFSMQKQVTSVNVTVGATG
jgi:hypothetical protein